MLSLSNLDALTRSTLQQEILKIWDEERRTCLMITNDLDKAILFANRIVPLNPGPKASLGTAFDVSLARSRNQAELNQAPTFRDLRNSITNYLVEVRKQSRVEAAETSGTLDIELPNLEPQDISPPSRAIFGGGPPRSLRHDMKLAA